MQMILNNRIHNNEISKIDSLANSNKSTVNALSFNEIFEKTINSNSNSIREVDFDLKRVEKYYDGQYWNERLIGTYYADQDYLFPKPKLLSNGEIAFFPPKNAPDSVKQAFFVGLEKLSIEERKMVHFKIGAHYNMRQILAENDLGIDRNTLSKTTENWNSTFGNDNISYQNLFEGFVNHFKNYAELVSDPNLKMLLRKHQHAHQVILNSFIEYGIE